jgi:hypothetical protein
MPSGVRTNGGTATPTTTRENDAGVTSTNVASYEQWQAAFQRAYEAPGELGEQPCPNCGVRALRLLFVVEHEDDIDSDGRAVFWCDNCRYGLMPNRSLVPPDARRVTDDPEVPDYTVVPPET